jgi:hypothetical protein
VPERAAKVSVTLGNAGEDASPQIVNSIGPGGEIGRRNGLKIDLSGFSLLAVNSSYSIKYI